MTQIEYRAYSPSGSTSQVRHLLRYAFHLYGFLFMVLFLCVADQALGHAGLLPINATALCAILLAPFMLRGCLKASSKTHGVPVLIEAFWRNRLVIISLSLIALVALLWSSVPTAYWGEDGKWIAVIPYDVCIALCSMSLGVYPWRNGELRLVIFTSLLALLGSLWYDMLYPGTFAELGNRSAGFPGNANFAALVAVVLCASGLDFGDNHRSSPSSNSLLLNTLFLLCSFLVVTITMSRSGLINFFGVLLAYGYFRLIRSSAPVRRRLQEVLILAGLATLAALLVLWIGALGTSTESDSRLVRFLNNQQVDDGSAATRLAAVHDSIRLIEDSPWVGHGTGFARTMSELPHNLYLQQWVNNGIAGFFAYLFFLVVTFHSFSARSYRNGQVLTLVATIGSIFSHNVLDQRPFLILIGLFLADSQMNPARFVFGINYSQFRRKRNFGKPTLYHTE